MSTPFVSTSRIASALAYLAGAGCLLAVVACGSSSDDKGTDEAASGAEDKKATTDSKDDTDPGTTIPNVGGADFPKDQLPAELSPDLPLVAPRSDLEIPIFSDIVEVKPGEDVTFCTFSDVVLDEATIFGESFGAQSPQGHHAILQYTTTPTEPGTHSCASEGMASAILLSGTGGKTISDKGHLPPNFGVEVPAGAQLVMNHHWINTSDETVHGQAMMLARKLERGGDTVLAGSMIMIGMGWEIPAQAPLTYSTECEFKEDVAYVIALGHMHEFGSSVQIDVTHPDGTAKSIIDRKWTADEATGASGAESYSLDEPMMINKGDKVKLTCNWNNTTTEALGFPREMCVFFGNTIGQNFFCANGLWLDAAAAKAAGSQDIIDNL